MRAQIATWVVTKVANPRTSPAKIRVLFNVVHADIGFTSRAAPGDAIHAAVLALRLLARSIVAFRCGESR